MRGDAVSNENNTRKGSKDAALGLIFLFAVFGTLFSVMNRGQTQIRMAEMKCDNLYRSALNDTADLTPVKNCYTEIFRLKPWNREAAFKVQSVGDLERERTHPLQPTPLSEIAHGRLNACDRIESYPLLIEEGLAARWLKLCLMLTR